MRTVLLGAVTLAACSAYQPGSYTYNARQFSGARTVVGCLDLAIERRPDLGKSAVLDYQFGNRCNKAELVDLADVRVVGRTADGTEHRLAPYDPQGQLMTLKLDGRYGGGEAIAYPSEEPIVQVCVDAASLVQAKPERWLCFARVGQEGEPYVGQEGEPVVGQGGEPDVGRGDEPIGQAEPGNSPATTAVAP